MTPDETEDFFAARRELKKMNRVKKQTEIFEELLFFVLLAGVIVAGTALINLFL